MTELGIAPSRMEIQDVVGRLMGAITLEDYVSRLGDPDAEFVAGRDHSEHFARDARCVERQLVYSRHWQTFSLVVQDLGRWGVVAFPEPKS